MKNPSYKRRRPTPGEVNKANDLVSNLMRSQGLTDKDVYPSFPREGDWHQGYEDAKNGFPRESTRPYYRAGYDRGLAEVCESASEPQH